MTISPNSEMLASDMLNLTMLPKDTVLMYDGAGWVNNVTLVGWYQCDGQNGTPDLRDRFIMGASNRGQTGGRNSVTLTMANLPAHTHSLGELGDHTGTFVVDDMAAGNPSGGVFSAGDTVGYDASSKGAWGGKYIKMNATHSKTSLSNTGVSKVFDKLPGYYSVIYIKKMVSSDKDK